MSSDIDTRNPGFFHWLSRGLHLNPFKVALKYLFRIPMTELYHPAHPEYSEHPDVAYRYRGILSLDMEACTGCRKCERICPNKTIIMVNREINGDVYRYPAWFAGRCLFCGLCEEVCDRQFAIRHTDQFELAGFQREELYFTPERMNEYWVQHIQPKIDIGMTHDSVPDRKKQKSLAKIAQTQE